MRLEDLEIYQIAMKIGEEVWEITKHWEKPIKNTMGMQLIRSADSVAANISEGFGRYHYKDAKLFNYYARGSLYETKTWLAKAQQRKLITDEEYEMFKKEIDKLGVKLNNYINSIGKKR